VSGAPRFSLRLGWRRGQPVVVKAARGGDAAAVLREAALLSGLDQPVDVVDIVGVVHDGPWTALVTHWAGVHTLATAPAMSPWATVRAVSDLAATVAALHDCGLVHRRLDTTHVVMSPGGTPTLCGLRSAQPVSPEGRHADRTALGTLAARVVSDVLTQVPRHRRGHRTLLGDCADLIAIDHVGVDQLARALQRLLDDGRRR
jgi:hypothetical protein